MSLESSPDFAATNFSRKSRRRNWTHQNGGTIVRQKVLDYLGRGIEVEEILDLWNVAFPETWNVSYDEDADTIHYLIEPEAIQQAD